MSDVLNSQQKTPGDLLVHVESLGYCTKTVSIRNQTGADVLLKDIVGAPLKAGANGADYLIAEVGDEANVTALLIDGPAGYDTETLANNTTSAKKYQALVHSPAVLNQNKLPLLDFAAATWDQAALRTRLVALNYELRAEPVKFSML